MQILNVQSVAGMANDKLGCKAHDIGGVQVPVKLIDRDGLRLWHCLDTSFRTPRTAAFFVVHLPGSYTSPQAAAATRLALQLLKDSLNETSYMADTADLEYSVSC